ncbi:hypothetical protein M3_0193 [Lysinibacillus phage vB_LfM_LysYB1]|nr:hypothetical protein M3_0193 [Lysinibacillus phage vB_LfM_LysYB1]WAB25295.1 hypothetical protein M5_0117 [Lysinibacillus phage vB_LfM_LysYB2]
MVQPNPYISTSMRRLKKQLNLEGATKAEKLKNEVGAAVQKGVDDFIFRLYNGQVKIDNVGDFEKLVKLGLLVNGEATEKVEVTTDIVQEEQFQAIAGTDEFEKIKAMLAAQMNKQNEGN